MKIQIENLKAQMQGRDLNIYQKADALIEFNKLLEYVEELEQLSVSRVTGKSEQLVCSCGSRLVKTTGGYHCGNAKCIVQKQTNCIQR